MKNSRLYLQLAIIVLIAILIFPFLFSKEENNELPKKEIETYKLVPEMYSENLDLSGSLEANKETAVAAKVSGRISTINSEIGDFVIEGTLLGALSGATYVSSFVGRLDDRGHIGMELVAEIVQMFEHYNFPTQVIAASIRHPLHCVAAAKAGAHIATVPHNVLKQMVEHPLTTEGIERFLKDWQRVTPSKPNIT